MIYLVFPTSWHPSQPYLSLPSLKAFLNQNGVHDVVQRDLAIELLNDLCTWEKTKPLYERIIRELNELSSRPSLSQVESEKFAKLREAEEIVMALKDQIDFAINSQRSPDFYEIDQYRENLKVMDATAITLCMDNDLPIVMFDLMTSGNVRAILAGESVGTLVS